MNSKEVFAKFVELEQEIIRIKELNREMVEVIRGYLYDSSVVFEDERLKWIDMQVYKDTIAEAKRVYAKVGEAK